MTSKPGPERAIAVLLAGGKSSRMMQDKSLMPFGGYKTLGEYQYRRLEKLFEKVYISTKEEKFDFGPSLVLDRYPQNSPLVGLVSAFEMIPEKEFFVLSVDAPFVSQDVIEKLYEAGRERSYDAIIAESPGGVQPMCGIYRRSIVPCAKSLMAKEDHRLTNLLRASESRYVNFDAELPFQNLNHPQDYEAALEIIRNEGPGK